MDQPSIPLLTSLPADHPTDAQLRKAPLMAVPRVANASEPGLVLEVKRVIIPRGPNGKWPDQNAYVHTTDDKVFRLPPGLFGWAYDLISVVLVSGGNSVVKLFPAKVDFG